MQKIHYNIRKRLRLYVNCIMTDASTDPCGSLALPIYADGYPGLMFQKSDQGFYLLPKNKKLSELFLYGQTVSPVSMTASGAYELVALQLYPFASRYLLNIDPKTLNDDCYDLLQLQNIQMAAFLEKLKISTTVEHQIETMLDIVEALLEVHSVPEVNSIQQVVHRIIQSNGQIRVSELTDAVCLTERTLERNFLSQVGLSPKQFARIIQFQSSLEKINTSEFDKLTDIGLESGFSDQSHFIRVFKAYTGLSPSQYIKKMSTAA